MSNNKCVTPGASPEKPRKLVCLRKCAAFLMRIKPDIVFYTFTLLLAFFGKLFYSLAQTRMLFFLLTPASWLVSVFTSIPFEYHPLLGYINELTGIVIGKSCSGMNYLIILYAMTTMSFIRCFRTTRGKILFHGIALAGSYLVSVFITASRILVSVWLFFTSEHVPFLKADLTHKVTGIVVYVTSLIICYSLAQLIVTRTLKRTSDG